MEPTQVPFNLLQTLSSAAVCWLLSALSCFLLLSTGLARNDCFPSGGDFRSMTDTQGGIGWSFASGQITLWFHWFYRALWDQAEVRIQLNLLTCFLAFSFVLTCLLYSSLEESPFRSYFSRILEKPCESRTTICILQKENMRL